MIDTSDIPEVGEEWFKRARLVMPDKAKDQTVVPDNASHNPPSTGKMSPGAGHSKTPTEDNEKDVVKKPDQDKDVRDDDYVKG